MRTIIVIQLRTGSTRLARKIFLLVDKDEMWEKIYKTAISTGLETVLAIPSDDQQLNYVQHRVKGAYNWITGSHYDLIDRFKQVAETMKLSGEDRIVRITGDCPLITKESILSAVYGAEGKEYYYNGIDGFDTEVFTINALVEADENTADINREHVTMYLREKYMPWTLKTKHMLSVDEMKDLELVKEVIKNVR